VAIELAMIYRQFENRLLASQLLVIATDVTVIATSTGVAVTVTVTVNHC
jgi:hypothetical protein